MGMGKWFKVQDFWEYMEGGRGEEVTLLFKILEEKNEDWLGY
jgi:hypothetical protein